MIVRSPKIGCKLPIVVPLVYFFLRGVAKLTELQDEGLKHSNASLGGIDYSYG